MADAIEIISNGLSAARMRINVLASNIANAETTRTPEGGPYKRKDIVQVANPIRDSFSSVLDKMSMSKPSVLAVVEDQTAPRKVYQPGHPDADQDGNVAYPNLNLVTEMTDMVNASRLYQANITALETARKLQDEASQIAQKY